MGDGNGGGLELDTKYSSEESVNVLPGPMCLMCCLELGELLNPRLLVRVRVPKIPITAVRFHLSSATFGVCAVSSLMTCTLLRIFTEYGKTDSSLPTVIGV